MVISIITKYFILTYRILPLLMPTRYHYAFCKPYFSPALEYFLSRIKEEKRTQALEIPIDLDCCVLHSNNNHWMLMKLSFPQLE